MKFNRYRIRDYKVNKELVNENYPYYNTIENQQHVITCPAIYNMINNMTSKLIIKLSKVPTYNEDEEIIKELVEEIKVYLWTGQANRTN